MVAVEGVILPGNTPRKGCSNFVLTEKCNLYNLGSSFASWFGHLALSPEGQVVVCLEDQVVMLTLAQHVVDSTETLEDQFVVAVRDIEVEDVVVQRAFLE